MNPGGIPRDFPEEKLCGSIPVEIPDEIATKFLWINFCFFFKQLQEFQQESQYEFLQECKEDLLEEYQVKFTTRIKIFLKEIFSGISGEIQAAVSGEIPAGFQNSLQFFLLWQDSKFSILFEYNARFVHHLFKIKIKYRHLNTPDNRVQNFDNRIRPVLSIFGYAIRAHGQSIHQFLS